MPASPYIRSLRERAGSSLLLLPGVAALIRDDSGRLLFIRVAETGIWSLPAGGIEPGESPADAVVREVYEETGLHVRPLRVAGVFGGADGFRVRYPNGHETEYTVVVFDCAIEGGVLFPVDAEASELKWFSAEEMPELDIGYPTELFSREPGVETLFQSPRGQESDRRIA